MAEKARPSQRAAVSPMTFLDAGFHHFSLPLFPATAEASGKRWFPTWKPQAVPGKSDAPAIKISSILF
jgi:hypothetical protein